MSKSTFSFLSLVAFLFLGGFGPLVLGGQPFVRGDLDGDGKLSIADPVLMLRAVVERKSLPCPDAADFSDNGLVQLGDAALLLEYLLKGAPDPRPPFPFAGVDPTEDGLSCDRPMDPPAPAAGHATYSLSVLPPVGGAPGFRLRVQIESTVGLFGGRIALSLPEGWADDSVALDIRPSLQLTARLKEDSFVAAKIGADRKLRCLWLLSQSDFEAAFPAAGKTPLFDVSVCPGATPKGTYDLGGELSEVVTADGALVEADVAPLRYENGSGPAVCPEVVESALSMRPSVWMTDARAEPGQAFRISLYSTVSFDARGVGYMLTWDPDLLRVIGADWVRNEGWLAGSLVNYEPYVGGRFYEPHTIIPSPNPNLDPRGIWICHPCTEQPRDLAPRVFLYFRNYVPLRDPPDPRRPYPADTEFHHIDVMFQVLPGTAPGEALIEFYEDPGTDREDNYAEPFRVVHPTEDEVHYVARPRLPGRVEILPSSGHLRLFTRGDTDGDGVILISDPIRILQRLFSGKTGAFNCDDALDANDDGRIDLSDAVFTLSWLFLGGRLLPPPNFYPGTDPTEDELDCGP